MTALLLILVIATALRRLVSVRRERRTADPGLVATDAVLASAHRLFGAWQVDEHVTIAVPPLVAEALTTSVHGERFRRRLRSRVTRALALRGVRDRCRWRRPDLVVEIRIDDRVAASCRPRPQH